jgi:hypothetical protein
MDWAVGQVLQTSYSDNSGHTANGLVTGNGNPDSNAGDQSQSGTSLVTGSSGLGSLNTTNAQSNSNAGEIDSATGTAGSMINAAAPTSASIMAMQSQTPVAPGTSAVIQSGANITSG